MYFYSALTYKGFGPRRPPVTSAGKTRAQVYPHIWYILRDLWLYKFQFLHETILPNQKHMPNIEAEIKKKFFFETA